MNLNDYVGLPWLWRGRDRAGVDCWGLCALVYREQLGIELPSFSDDYQNDADSAVLAELIEGHKTPWIDVAHGQEHAGDTCLMSMAGAPRHVGVVVGGGRVLHIERGAGSIIERYDTSRLKRRVVGFYRHEALA